MPIVVYISYAATVIEFLAHCMADIHALGVTFPDRKNEEETPLLLNETDVTSLIETKVSYCFRM